MGFLTFTSLHYTEFEFSAPPIKYEKHGGTRAGWRKRTTSEGGGRVKSEKFRFPVGIRAH